MEQTAGTVQVLYFSGYIRNWKSLCQALGLALDLPRREREEGILRLGYGRWGLDLPERLYGAFAAVLRDEAAGETVALRDQLGQKQLFYTVAGGELLCTGDLNAIAEDPRVRKRLNHRMLQQYLFFGYPIGEETFYEDVYKLMPGHTLRWDGRTLRLRRYWRPTFAPEHGPDGEAWARQLRETAAEIMAEERDDPALPHKESFLSGGVDSSYLLAAGDAACANTVGYAEPGFDESDLAARTAAVLGREFRVRRIGPEEYFARIPQVMAGLGQPLGDASAVAFSIGCAAVAEHAPVVYSGEGIDEFFGGYNTHKTPLGPGWTYLTCSHIMSEALVRELLLAPDDRLSPFDPVTALWQSLEGQDELSKKLTVDISLWLEGDIYLNTDRTSTACGVELHTPFSDLRLFNVARRIPPEWKLRDGQNKAAFRMAAAELLPEEIAFRKKVGFPVPIRKWLADPRCNGPVAETLFGASSQRFFRQEVLRDMWERFLAGEDLLWNRLYAVYAFLVWYGQHFAG